MFHQQTNTPGRRAQTRHSFKCWKRRVKRGVPMIPADASDKTTRNLCVEAGMPEHYNDHQVNNWISGEKLRGRGITTPMRM